MKNFWDQRYAEITYAYGKEPNVFFRQELDKMPAGCILLPAEGEGRNAVYAASQGWQVDAFDYSVSGQKKANQLAHEKNVSLNYLLSDIYTFDWPRDTYDAVGLFFVHLLPEARLFLHQKVMETLKPGGTLLLQGFSKEQLPLSTGGPKNPDMLFSTTLLEKDFLAYSLQLLVQESVILTEGPYHNGKAEVVKMVLKK